MNILSDKNELRDLAEGLLFAVRESGSIILDRWNAPRTVSCKGRIDLVTDTDVAVENDVLPRLRKLLPQADVVAEESAGNVPLGDLAWVVDPVDGTTNFAHGIPFVALSVGLWFRGQVLLGAVYAPILHECFHAVRGGGAFCNGVPVHVTDTANMEQALIATGFPYTIQEEAPTVLRRLSRVLVSARGVRRCGAAAVDLAYLAAGRYDAFYETGLKPWDTAAGWLLVEEAGGRVTGLDGHSPFDPRRPEILASNGQLHTQMAQTLR